MKKVIFAICLINLGAFAQPVLNRSDFNSISASNSYNVIPRSSSTITAGSPGANQIWDFSSFTLGYGIGVESWSEIAPVYASLFPTSNVYKSRSIMGGHSYDYYNLTDDKFEYIGYSAAQTWSGSILYYHYVFPDSKTIYVFPFVFNQVVNDTYQTHVANSIVSTTTTYDAYGTLVTPFGTYNDVIRLKTIYDNTSVGYTWIKTNPYQEIVRGSVSTDGTNNFTFCRPSNLATTDNEMKSQFSIYPNPADNEFVINYEGFSNKEIFVNIYDILGNQIVKSVKIENNSKNINISNLALGLYLIKITDANNTILYSNKIIKK